MYTKSVLSLGEVNRMMAAAEAEAHANSWAVAIAVVDDGGHLLGFQRMDRVAPVCAIAAVGKAKSAALGVRDTHSFEEMINNGREAFLSVPLESMLEGGLPLIVDGLCIGAVGVSGAKPQQETLIARAALAVLAKI